MKIKSIIVLILSLSLFACQESGDQTDEQIQEEQNIENEFPKKKYYKKKMKEKNFSLTSNGPCDDALEDTLHERYTAYIDSLQINVDNVIVEFKFKDACCQEFLGDYLIKGDTLIFEFEQVNDEICTCICWYRYKLELKNFREKFKEIRIRGK